MKRRGFLAALIALVAAPARAALRCAPAKGVWPSVRDFGPVIHDFGGGTVAMLHGTEAVIPLSKLHELCELELDGHGLTLRRRS